MLLKVQVLLILCLSSFIWSQGIRETIEDGLSSYLKNVCLRDHAKVKVVESEQGYFVHEDNQHEVLFHMEYVQDNQKNIVRVRAFSEIQEPYKQQLYKKLNDKMNVTSWILQEQDEPLYYGLITKPYVNLKVKPLLEDGENLASQFQFGTLISVWEESKDFVRVRSELDHYIGWLSIHDYIIIDKKSALYYKSLPVEFLFNQWNEYAIGSMFRAVSKNNYIDITNLKNVPIEYYDYTTKKTCMGKTLENCPIITVPASPALPYTADSIIKTALRFINDDELKQSVYLWGGNFYPGLDCSGFVQLIFRLHGVWLPRDCDQMLEYCTPIEQDQKQAGDLLFFSRHRKYPTHIALYLGNNNYIHCSSKGIRSGVKINTLNDDTEYDKSLHEIYYATARIK